MMNFDLIPFMEKLNATVIGLGTSFSFELAEKLFLGSLLFFYVIFSLVVFKQIKIMTQNLSTNVSPFVVFVALLQLAASGSLFLMTLMLL